jgi:hypothetical protein
VLKSRTFIPESGGIAASIEPGQDLVNSRSMTKC